MGMMHYDAVLSNTVAIISEEIRKAQKDEAYIIQNVYGKILVYIKTENEKSVQQAEGLLAGAVGKWLNCCEKYGENPFVVPEIESWKREAEPVAERVWVWKNI